MIHACVPSKKWLVGLAIISVSFFTYRFLSPSKAPNHAFAPPPVEVGVAEVIASPVQQWKEFSGRLIAFDEVEIRPRVSGMIEAIHFKAGAIVQKGDKLFTLDKRSYTAEVERLQGELASSKAQANLHRTELARAEKLITEKVISQSEYDNRKNALMMTEALLQSKEAALKAAKLNLEFAEISAPITGRISRAEVTIGNLVEIGAHVKPLATLVSFNPIYADFEVDEKTLLYYVQHHALASHEVHKIPVLMGLATDIDTAKHGHIHSFDNRLNPTSGTIRVRAVFDNSQMKLFPGLFARLKLGEPKEQQAILITERAIGTDQNKKFVLVIDNENKINYREIKLGGFANNLRIVEQGLEAGEKIIVNGLQRARPGQTAIPKLEPMVPTANA